MPKLNRYLKAAKAESTRRLYESNWRLFIAWCMERGYQPIPAAPEHVAEYLADMANRGYKVRTIKNRLSTINQKHRQAGYRRPCEHFIVSETLKGICRVHGATPEKKAPATLKVIRDMVARLRGDLIGIRDKALLLIGFAGALGRLELVSLNVGDVEETSDGLILTVHRSKMDQEGRGRKVGIPYGSDSSICPVRALKVWLETSGIKTGPVFRKIDRHGNIGDRALTDHAIALIIKRSAEAAGYDPKEFSGLSLRAGFVTAASTAGVDDRVIVKHTGHRSVESIYHYVRDGDPFRDNAVKDIGL